MKSVDGCSNSVLDYSDIETALCTPCKENINEQLHTHPPPVGLCVCCHENLCTAQSSFCGNCSKLLTEDRQVDSGWGVWRVDKLSGETICIDYGKPM